MAHSAPTWVGGLFSGTLFGLFMGVLALSDDGRWARAVVAAVVAGAFFGIAMGLYAAHQRSDERNDVALQEDDYAAANAALRRRAAIPDDPAARHAAHALARRRSAVAEGQRVWTTVLFLAWIALCVVQALTSSPWQWLIAALFLALFVVSWLERRRLRRRVHDLAASVES